MTDQYDSNGDYYGDNFKRDNSNSMNTTAETEENNVQSRKATEYVKELLAEKLLMDQSKLPNAAKLIDQEVSKVQQLGRAPLRDNKYVDIYREKPIKVTVKVLVPVKEHPKFNFVGKLLGPKGNSMKRLQEETMCKMAVLGRGSMRDRNKEEELRTSLDPKYSHLVDDLHVEISALGPPAEAHARVAFALAEVRKYLIPDNNDFIRIEQMREMEIMVDPHQHPHPEEREMRPRRPPPPMIRAAPPRAPPPAMRAPAGVRPAPHGDAATASRGVMPAKKKIMSILDRARVAMEESYGYEEDGYEASGGGGYEEYAPPPHRGGGGGGYGAQGGGGYGEPEYEGGYFSRQGGSGYEAPRPASTWKTTYKGPGRPAPGGARNTGHAGGHTDPSRYRTTPYSRPKIN